MLTKRAISTIILTVLAASALLSAWASALVITVLIVLGLYEFFSMLEYKGIGIYKYFGIAMGLSIPVSIMCRFELTKGWELFFFILVLLFLIIMQFKRRESSGVIIGISTTIFGILYVSWFLSFLIRIRFMDGGLGFLASVLIITKLGDIGAYLVGVRFGKTPLIPRISPKKSLEGAFGGLLFSVLGALVCKPFLPFEYGHLIAIGIAGAILAQLGDLSESLMKRDCQIKDASHIIPGIGGVLDLIDSLLFTGPVFYSYLAIMLSQ
ncbi:MAG: phosphatidate cytidylyltransferase [Candidatus Omnitrophica bacterium]|nr:phosphatidate cytidylyltransferase [Candidatus Omnitrophota bacterium]